MVNSPSAAGSAHDNPAAEVPVRGAGTQVSAPETPAGAADPGAATAEDAASSPDLVGRGRAAARRVGSQEHIAVDLPVLGEVSLPHPQDLAFYGGLGALAVLELVEWPAAVVLAIGHALSSQHRNRAIAELGEALDEV